MDHSSDVALGSVVIEKSLLCFRADGYYHVVSRDVS